GGDVGKRPANVDADAQCHRRGFFFFFCAGGVGAEPRTPTRPAPAASLPPPPPTQPPPPPPRTPPPPPPPRTPPPPPPPPPPPHPPPPANSTDRRSPRLSSRPATLDVSARSAPLSGFNTAFEARAGLAPNTPREENLKRSMRRFTLDSSARIRH